MATPPDFQTADARRETLAISLYELEPEVLLGSPLVRVED
jgi:hypothetical protein